MNRLKKIGLSVSAFVAGMMGVMGVALVFADGDTSTAPSIHTDKAAAEDAAGYTIVTPSNMPSRATVQNYMVSGYKQDGRSVSVDQNWYVDGSTSKQWITVTQGPIPMGLSNSKATAIDGQAAERVLYPSRDGRPYQVLALYWPHEGGHLGVVGSISADQTEADLEAIAGSLINSD